MQPDEGVEQEHAGTQPVKRTAEALLVGLLVEPERIRGDDVDRQRREFEPTVATDRRKPLLDDHGRVLGHVDQDATGVLDLVDAEARPARRQADGHLEGEPALEALGFATNQADARLGPHSFEEPGRL